MAEENTEKKKKRKAPQTEAEVNAALLEQLKVELGLSKDEISFASQYESITDVISTGCPDLDQLLTPIYHEQNGKGGVPLGYVCEFFGPTGGGKTSLCQKLMGSVTSNKGLGIWMDAEHSYVKEWAEAQGTITERVIMLQRKSMSAEDQLTTFNGMIRRGDFRLAVCDSVAGLTPKRMLETSLSDNERMGEKARLMSRVLPMTVQAAAYGNCAVVFINQIRKNISGYGNPETTPGGEALKFYASLRLKVTPLSKDKRTIMKDGEAIGLRSSVEIPKSRFGPPNNQSVMPIYFRKGEKPHPLDALMDAAISKRVISVKKPKESDDEDRRLFTFAPKDEKGKALPGFANVLNKESVEALKEAFQPVQLKAVLDACLAKNFIFDPDVPAYVAGLLKGDEDDEESEVGQEVSLDELAKESGFDMSLLNNKSPEAQK